jgi:hypothetical protein
MHASDVARFERRLYLYTFVRTVWFYLPVLVHSIVGELREVGAEQPHTVAMSTLVIFSFGVLVAEYPSGVFADWAGRKRALALSCVFNIAGASLYVLSSSLTALFAGQFIFGLSAAFRSGSDSALLHSHLERVGAPERYSAALAYMRIASHSGIVMACFTGGFLYAWWPPAVFAGTALCSLVALVLLYGLEEPPRPIVHDRYFGVLRASLAEVRHHRPVRAILLLGGFGSTFFIFLFWTMQSYLVEIGAPVEHNGFVVGTTSLLSAISLTALSWCAASRRRHGMAMGVLLFAIPCALLTTALAYRLGWLWLGAAFLVITAMGQVLFRNLANVRLQALVPDAVRASLVSLDSWLASLLYVPVFPIGGALLDAWSIDGGYVAIAVLVLLPSLPLYTWSWRHRVWQGDEGQPRL